MSSYTNLPAPSPEQGLNRYMQEIRKFPMLEPDEEYMLAKRWVKGSVWRPMRCGGSARPFKNMCCGHGLW